MKQARTSQHVEAVHLTVRDFLVMRSVFRLISFVFFRNEQGAAAALENPRITIKDKVANVLAKKQILGSGGR